MTFRDAKGFPLWSNRGGPLKNLICRSVELSLWPPRFCAFTSVLVMFLIAAVTLSAQTAPAKQTAKSTLTLDTGKQIYEAGCVSCHGPDGKGQSRNLAGFEPPSTFPDFSDCPTSTRGAGHPVARRHHQRGSGAGVFPDHAVVQGRADRRIRSARSSTTFAACARRRPGRAAI